MPMLLTMKNRDSSLIWIFLTAFAFCLAFASPSHAQQLARRLILTDGSYQTVTKYEVKGDRVRYLSAERNEWEELPSSLVDWPATEKYEKDRVAAPAIPEAAELDKEFSADRAAKESLMPQVAPGLRLPELSGMYLLDNFNGQPQLVEVQQNEGGVTQSAKGNILREALPAGGGIKATIELEGDHATVYSHVAVPSIYIKVDDDSADQPPPGQTDSAKPSKPSLDAPRAQPQGPEQPQQAEKAVIPFDRFRILHLKVKNGKRIVGDIKRTTTGKANSEQNSVKTTIDRVAQGWLKLTPIDDLPPGEYAIIESKGSEGMNLYVWPFSVNPKAPANTNPWTPNGKDKENGEKQK
jgi:hypothetical protein